RSFIARRLNPTRGRVPPQAAVDAGLFPSAGDEKVRGALPIIPHNPTLYPEHPDPGILLCEEPLVRVDTALEPAHRHVDPLNRKDVPIVQPRVLPQQALPGGLGLGSVAFRRRGSIDRNAKATRGIEHPDPDTVTVRRVWGVFF